MACKQINIHVKTEFVVPDVYNKGTMEEVEEALWIGANIQYSIKTRRSNDEVRKISELKDYTCAYQWGKLAPVACSSTSIQAEEDAPPSILIRYTKQLKSLYKCSAKQVAAKSTNNNSDESAQPAKRVTRSSKRAKIQD